MKKNLKYKRLEEKVVIGSGTLLLLLFGLYGYFINATILNIVGERNMENQTEQASAKVSQLEYQYVALSSGLNMAYAEQLGFHPVDNPEFAERQSSQAVAFAQ
ncbi:MAG TPA: hypothetical protein VFM02_00155 [Candidatus Paceibacterota bacterium]|nr:hypothetical protein [Candidatus Paceibacterota bacterium]